jgi:hypothetical protein
MEACFCWVAVVLAVFAENVLVELNGGSWCFTHGFDGLFSHSVSSVLFFAQEWLKPKVAIFTAPSGKDY